MSFNSLDGILRSLENQPGFQVLKQFKCLLECWPEVVGSEVASQTRPISISRDVLSVAASSSALANNLMFSRQTILKKLNARLPSPLVDIRFSTARWQNNSRHSAASPSVGEVSLSFHPSRVEDVASLPPSSTSPIQDPLAAFEHWAEVVRARYQHLPPCPQCQCPTPLGELDRWGVCALCAPQSF